MRHTSSTAAIAVAFTLLIVSGAARAAPVVVLSSPADLTHISPGQTITINVSLAELMDDEELALLAAGVRSPNALFEAPSTLRAGGIVPDPSPDNFQTNIDVQSPVIDPRVSNTIFTDAIFEAADEGEGITRNGTFFSFDLMADRPGSGEIAFDFADALLATGDPLNPTADAGVRTGVSLGVTVIPLPPGVASGLLTLGLLVLGGCYRRFTMKAQTGCAALAAAMLVSGSAMASSHREAPITALDSPADITDVYAFVNYGPDQAPNTPPSKVTIIMCVDPLLDPAFGPTFTPFDPEVLYEINIDNNQDAKSDFIFQFQFTNEFQLPDVFTGLVGINDGANAPGTDTLVIPPKIRDFDNPGLNFRQSYVTRMVSKQKSNILANADGSPMFAVPDNIGPRTIDYEAVFEKGIYTLSNGMRIFAGTVDDPFFLDIGAAFDTFNFRNLEGPLPPGVLTEEQDSAQRNFAPDGLSGFAVNAIAIEIPIEMLTRNGQLEPASSPHAVVGVWAATSRPRVKIRRSPEPGKITNRSFRQVQRLANPLVNELLIGIGSKDRWSMSQPIDDAQFANFLLDPLLPKAVQAVYGDLGINLSIPAAPRNDLLPLVTYAPPIAPEGTQAGPVADLLRLNTGVPATPLDQASRLGLLAGDPAGFPNGRRLFDDAPDILLRVVVGGVLVTPTFAGFEPNVNGRLGDGVNVNLTPRNPPDGDNLDPGRGYRTSFPYLANCPSGRDHRHIDAGEEIPNPNVD